MKNIKISVQTELITSNDGKNTYEVIKRLEGCEGECAFIISLYPTRNAENISANDSTLNHLVSHFNDLGLNELHIINLFSKVVNGKMSVRGLEPDKENLKYIDELMADKKFQSSKFIVAWGNSFKSSSAVSKSKAQVLKLFAKHNPKGRIYQLSTAGNKLDSDNSPHPLYVGIRGKNSVWCLKEFSLNSAVKN